VLFHFSMVIMFLILGAAFVLIALELGRWIRPKRMGKNRNTTYECGEIPTGIGWYNFNPRFFMLALVFLIFDVEVVLTYRVVVVLREWAGLGKGWIALLEIALFVAILVSGLAFLWKRDDLEWIKKL
jgi:NADH-quinone oxidoreductase subunit A